MKNFTKTLKLCGIFSATEIILMIIMSFSPLNLANSINDYIVLSMLVGIFTFGVSVVSKHTQQTNLIKLTLAWLGFSFLGLIIIHTNLISLSITHLPYVQFSYALLCGVLGNTLARIKFNF